jgi:hypothetical protein
MSIVEDRFINDYRHLNIEYVMITKNDNAKLSL